MSAAFYARSNDGSEDLYCGYSIGNTVYRSVIAGVSIIIAFVSMAGVLESMPKVPPLPPLPYPSYLS